MARVRHKYADNGFFGIGIVNNVDEINIGTLWRSAYILGASFIFTVDKKYQKQGSDVVKAWIKIPLYHYQSVEDLKEHLPYNCPLIGVELTPVATPLGDFKHPPRAVYLLGNEQIGLSDKILEQCHSVISLPGYFSLNVAVTGSIIMYDRISQIPTALPKGRE